MATSKIDKEPQAEQDPFHEILQRMESHFTSQGDLLENLNQQLQKVIADGVGHWPSQGSDESVEAPRASPLVLHDEPLQPEHPIERSSERAKLQQNRHSMDSKESKISLGLDSNMTHEPHQAQQRRSEEHGISSVATFVTQEIRRQERVARQAARKLTEQKLSSINAAMYWSQRPKEENFAHRIINSWWFVNGISSVIVINMILLGVEVDLAASIGQENVPVWYGVVNATAVGIFVIELSLTFLAIGIRKFFCGKNRAWNIFDFCIISLSLLETSTELWQQAIAREQVSTSQLRFFRSVRLVRALRGVRMVRLLRYVGALRTLVLSIASSMASLFWTLVLLVLIFYTFGIMFTQLVSDYCRYEVGSATMAGCVDKVGVYWSSLPESMLTLFMTISGGVNWGETFRPLIDISIFAVMCHIIFTTIAVLAVEESSPRSPRSLFCLQLQHVLMCCCSATTTRTTSILFWRSPLACAAAAGKCGQRHCLHHHQVNVVTGVFCTTAMESAAADKEIATMKQLKKKNAQLEDLRNAFEEIVDAESNTVNIGDFEKAMRSDKFRHFLESMSISTEDISTLFTIMDSDQSGLIDLEEFVQGCLQLHGPAKSLQLAKMSFENKITRQAMKSMATSLMEVRAQLDRMSRKALLPRKRRSQLRQPVCSI